MTHEQILRARIYLAVRTRLRPRHESPTPGEAMLYQILYGVQRRSAPPSSKPEEPKQ